MKFIIFDDDLAAIRQSPPGSEGHIVFWTDRAAGATISLGFRLGRDPHTVPDLDLLLLAIASDPALLLAPYRHSRDPEQSHAFFAEALQVFRSRPDFFFVFAERHPQADLFLYTIKAEDGIGFSQALLDHEVAPASGRVGFPEPPAGIHPFLNPPS